MGLEIYPTGTMHHDTMDYLLKPGTDGARARWEQPGSMRSAVELVRRNGWAGLQYDNEISKPNNPLWDERLPAQYDAFVGNLSAALDAAGFRLIIDVTSTWHGNIAGPDYLGATARAAPEIMCTMSSPPLNPSCDSLPLIPSADAALNSYILPIALHIWGPRLACGARARKYVV